MSANYTQMLVGISKKRRSTRFKLLSLFFGFIVFIAVLPWLLFLLADVVMPDGVAGLPRLAELVIAAAGASVGLAVVAWTALTQWKTGRGTPAPVAPTQCLIVSGPYAFCRNPIELGAILYYLGTGTFFGNLAVGLACMLLGFVIGSTYHKFVEEKELRMRFGEEYEAYRKRVPFLIPRWPRG